MSTYNDRINKHILPSCTYADRTLREESLVALCKQHPDVREIALQYKTDLTSMMWNRLYHMEMDRRTSAEGTRYIGYYAHLHPKRQRARVPR